MSPWPAPRPASGRPRPPNYIILHYTILYYTTLHYITLHYITLHYITLYPRGASEKRAAGAPSPELHVEGILPAMYTLFWSPKVHLYGSSLTSKGSSLLCTPLWIPPESERKVGCRFQMIPSYRFCLESLEMTRGGWVGNWYVGCYGAPCARRLLVFLGGS